MRWRSKAPGALTCLLIALGSVVGTAPPDVTVQRLSDTAPLAARYRAAATRAATFLEAWLGPLPPDPLVIAAVPWRTSAPLDDGTIEVPQRWRTLPGDRTPERFIIAALARRYWFDLTTFTADDRWLAGGLARFTAVRVAAETLDGDHFAAPAFFRGALAFPVRYAPLTSDWWEGRPPPTSFAEVERVLAATPPAVQPRAVRASRALQTLERYLGQPVLDSALAEFARRARGRTVSARDFTTTIEEVTGRDLAWFFDSAFDVDARYDYAIGQVQSEPTANGHHATVSVQRLGTAAFTGTSQAPSGPFDEGRAIEILATFADGTETRTFWDGRAESRVLEFASQAPLVDVTVDPAAMLLLDENWSNNRVRFAPPAHAATAQWALLWMAWLQHAMLSVTAIV